MEISPPRIDLIAILQQNNGEQSLADRLEALVQRTSVDGQLPLICQSLTRLAERAEFDIALSWELWQLAIRHEVWRGQYTSLEEFKEEYNYNVALKHVLQSHGLSKSQVRYPFIPPHHGSSYTDWFALSAISTAHFTSDGIGYLTTYYPLPSNRLPGATISSRTCHS